MSRFDDEFVEFVNARAPALCHTAYLLCGDWHRGEDLVQTALVKLFRVWPKVIANGPPEAYARQILTRSFLEENRRFWWRERASPALPDLVADEENRDMAVDVRRALLALPARQRAVVVLRYWEDLSISETARLLRCSEGTVKSQAAKGLTTLRRMATEEFGLLEGHQ